MVAILISCHKASVRSESDIKKWRIFKIDMTRETLDGYVTVCLYHLQINIRCSHVTVLENGLGLLNPLEACNGEFLHFQANARLCPNAPFNRLAVGNSR